MNTMEIDYDTDSQNFTMEGLISQVDIKVRKLPSGVTVCLGFLCVVLLAGNIGQIIYYASRHTPVDLMQTNYDALTAERKQLEAGLMNQTKEKDQLQTSYNNLTQENDQLQTSYDDMQMYLEELKTNNSNLQAENDKLQTNYIALFIHYYSLNISANRLQTKYDLMQRVWVIANQRMTQTITKMTRKIKSMQCQTGWHKLDTSCFFVSTEKKNWTSSRKDCIAKGADLVVIDSSGEQAFVNWLLKSDENAWIGLTDSLKEGTWTWVDGTPVITTYWEAGQPNNYSGNQDCGEVVERSSGVGVWNDEACSVEQLYICEQ